MVQVSVLKIAITQAVKSLDVLMDLALFYAVKRQTILLIKGRVLNYCQFILLTM